MILCLLLRIAKHITNDVLASVIIEIISWSSDDQREVTHEKNLP